MHLCTVYAAARDILPRQQVQPQDLTAIRIPSAYVLEGVCTDPEAVIGRYTEIQGMNGHISKPINADELLQKLTAAFTSPAKQVE